MHQSKPAIYAQRTHAKRMHLPRIALVSLLIFLLSALQGTTAQSAATAHSSTAQVQNDVHSIEPDASNILVIGDFETDSEWTSIVRQPSTAYTGSYAGQWTDHQNNPDASRYFSPAFQVPDGHKFQFWLHSAVANRAGVSVVIETDSSASNEFDHYIYDLTIDWTGWRFFNLSIADFRKNGTPDEWNKIQRIRLNTNGWGNKPAPDTALIFDDIQFAPQIIGATHSNSQTVNGRTVWQHQVTLQNNTGADQQFGLAAETLSNQQLDLSLSQSTVTIGNGQTQQFTVDVALPDTSQNLLDLQKVDLSVLIDNKRIDNLVIATFPALPDHPRLYTQAEDIAALQARYNNPTLAYVKNQLIDQMQAADSGTSPTQRGDTTIRRSIEARAFLYLANGDVSNGQKAIEMTLEYLDSLQKPYSSLNDARELYESIIAAAMVYDWCYDLLTDAQRQEMVSGIKKLAGLSEFGWPFVEKATYLTGHFGEHAPVALLAAGIAIFDEDQELFNTIYPGFIEGLAPSRNAYYGMGKHHQGTSYAVSRFFHEAHSALLFNAIDYNGIYNQNQSKVPYHMLYARTPSGKFLTEGDSFDPKHIDPRIQLIMAQLYNDPNLMNEARRLTKDGRYWTLQDSARTFMFWDPTVPQSTIEDLPTARYFPSPSGSMVARTGWDIEGGENSNVAMAMMNIGEYYFGNHAHLDAGHFGLYYKGTLALDSGVYEGSGGGYNSRHSRNYYQRTIAHNSLLIEDPNEPLMLHYGYEVETRDGGQYRSNFGNEWDSIEQMFDNGKRAEVLAHQIGNALAPDYTYLKGDLTPGYNAPAEYDYPAKAEEIKRSFVFLDLKDGQHPAALIVFDKVTATNAAFKKKWLLHSVAEPQISGSRISVTRTDGANNGRMVTDVLLPATGNQQIDKIGGTNYEFWVDNRNIYSSPNNSNVEPGAWRVELSPANPATSDTFLNVMQVMDADGGPAPLTTAMLDSDQMVGVQIADRAVFFSKNAQLLDDEVNITVNSGTALVKTLVTDLQPGQWYVQSSSGTQTATASADGKSIYFSAAPDSYRLTRDLSLPAPTAAPTQQATATSTQQTAPTQQASTPQSTPTQQASTPQPTPTQPDGTPQPTVTPWPTIALPTATPQPTQQPDGDTQPFAESFDGISGILNGVNQWKTVRAYVETNPSQDIYQALSMSGANASAQRPLPVGIAQGEIGTVHFRIKRTGDADIFVGLSDLSNPTDFNAFEVQFGSQFGPFSNSAPNNFMARDGAEARNLDAQFEPDAWHCIWLVIDNATDRYEVHAKGGSLSEITQIGSGEQTSFAFRNSTADRLQTFYARTGSESSKVYIDDIYLTPNQINLNSNTAQCRPEGSVPPTATSTPTATPENTPIPGMTPVPGATQIPNITPIVTKTPTAFPTSDSTPSPTSTPDPLVTATPTAPGTSDPPPTATPTGDPSNGGTRNITGRVFIDENGNGQYDIGERVFPELIVILIDISTAGQVLTITAATDEEGIYRFMNVPATQYIMSYAIPPGYTSNSGSNFLIDTTGGNVEGPSVGLTQTAADPTDGAIFLPFVTR